MVAVGWGDPSDDEAPDYSGDEIAGMLIHSAFEVVTDSRDTHGDAVENMEHIAEGWTWYLRAVGVLDEDESIPGPHAARMMELVKLSRTSIGTYDPDHDRDTAGYAGIATACEAARGNATLEEIGGGDH